MVIFNMASLLTAWAIFVHQVCPNMEIAIQSMHVIQNISEMLKTYVVSTFISIYIYLDTVNPTGTTRDFVFSLCM